MAPITRRRFLRAAGTLSVTATLPGTRLQAAGAALEWPGGEVGNPTFRLILAPQDGLRHTRLVHIPTGLILADGDYSYSFGQPKFLASSATKASDRTSLVSLRGMALADQLEILHEFTVPYSQPWIEEQFTLTNRGSAPLDLRSGRCGFVLPILLPGGKAREDWDRFQMTAVPYHRGREWKADKYVNLSFAEVLAEPCMAELWTHDQFLGPLYPSEGWAWTDGQQGFLLTKYSQRGMEYALLDRVPLEGEQTALRWGGYGIFRGDPEHGASLIPGESHRFGVTRLTAYSGGVTEGFYTFRQEMAERGHGCPKDFDPPVHWNEIYDNKLWWLGWSEQQDNPDNRRKYYTLADMKEEAAKARAIGAEGLYMDPGWDTNFGSKIWDESRLGPYRAFTTMLMRDYALKSSLHTPLSGWCNPSSYAQETYRMDRDGHRLEWNHKLVHEGTPICGASRQYLEETARRLNLLARDGAAFFMFDGPQYRGECWDPQHGHVVPARREEHVQGICRLARMVHAAYPDVLIEMHDPVGGGLMIRYTPTYYGHGQAPDGEQYSNALGFDEVWAFELMWKPMEDLLSRRAVALYYYNLAYSLPLYIHVDLRTDNEHALMFWWNASTCRHLGIGGTPKDVAVHRAHLEAMATYRRLEPVFKAGAFYGIDETAHVHVHPHEAAAVVNCFNLDDKFVRRQLDFVPGKCGLEGGREYSFEGVPARRHEKGYALTVDLPPHGHRVVEVKTI